VRVRRGAARRGISCKQAGEAGGSELQRGGGPAGLQQHRDAGEQRGHEEEGGQDLRGRGGGGAAAGGARRVELA
jgi:hypothetical protein